MAFGARDIIEKDFPVVLFRGYKVKDVDDFLDVVANEMEKLQQSNKALEDKVKKLEEQITQADSSACDS